MLGLRKPEVETAKFLKFFELVQQKEEKAGKVYFVDGFEGKEDSTAEFDCIETFGYLIDKADEATFIDGWSASKVAEKWHDDFCWAEYRIDGEKVTVEFVFYPDVFKDDK